jgi:outer membrane receptor for ferrienterochelin and colicins
MKSRNLVLACACAAALVSAASQGADVPDLADMSIEQLMDLDIESVFGASRYEQRVTQAPSSISIMTSQEIRRFGYTNLEDVLNSFRGMYVMDDRNYTYLGVRGFHQPGDYNTRVLVLVDGHRLNDNLYDSGSIGREAMVDLNVVERVEFIRGPSSSVYGSSAFFGVINVVTKRGHDIDGFEVSQEAGSLDTYRTTATYGATFADDTDFLVSLSHYSSEGMDRIYYPEFDQRVSDDPRARNDGLALHLDDERAAKVFTSLRSDSWSTTAYFSDRTKQVPTASYETVFADPGNRTKDQRGYVDFALNGELSAALSYDARAFYDYISYIGSLPYDYAAPEDPSQRYLYRDIGRGKWYGTELNMTANLASHYTLVAGVEYRKNLTEKQIAYEDVEPRLYYLDVDTDSRALGLFAQVEAKLREDFTVTAGLRFDDYSDVDDTVNPRLAAIYNPTPTSAVKLLYGEAYRAPNPYERFYYYEEQQFHPTLGPETIRTTELVYESHFGNRYRLNLSGYHYDIENLISQRESADVVRYFANVDAVEAQGAELELEGKYRSGAIARVSYAYQRAEDERSGIELTASPRHLAKLAVSVPVARTGVFGNVELRYQSDSLTLAGARSPSFVITNLSVTTQKLWTGVDLSFAIHNVFDADEIYPASEEHTQDTLELNGRTFLGKLAVHF